MRKTRKIINIALIFMLIGVLVCQEAYGLRVPFIDKDRAGKAPSHVNSRTKHSSLETIKKKIITLADSIDEKNRAIRFCKDERKISPTQLESLNPKFRYDRTSIKGLKTAYTLFLTSQIGHRLNARLSHRLVMIRHSFDKQEIQFYNGDYREPVLERVIGICEDLDEMIQLDDESLMRNLLTGLAVAIKFGGKVDKIQLSSITNFDEAITKAGELLEVYKNEVIKDELFELVRLCDANPEEVLKEWYASEQGVNGRMQQLWKQAQEGEGEFNKLVAVWIHREREKFQQQDMENAEENIDELKQQVNLWMLNQILEGADGTQVEVFDKDGQAYTLRFEIKGEHVEDKNIIAMLSVASEGFKVFEQVFAGWEKDYPCIYGLDIDLPEKLQGRGLGPAIFKQLSKRLPFGIVVESLVANQVTLLELLAGVAVEDTLIHKLFCTFGDAHMLLKEHRVDRGPIALHELMPNVGYLREGVEIFGFDAVQELAPLVEEFRVQRANGDLKVNIPGRVEIDQLFIRACITSGQGMDRASSGRSNWKAISPIGDRASGETEVISLDNKAIDIEAFRESETLFPKTKIQDSREIATIEIKLKDILLENSAAFTNAVGAILHNAWLHSVSKKGPIYFKAALLKSIDGEDKCLVRFDTEQLSSPKKHHKKLRITKKGFYKIKLGGPDFLIDKKLREDQGATTIAAWGLVDIGKWMKLRDTILTYVIRKQKPFPIKTSLYFILKDAEEEASLRDVFKELTTELNSDISNEVDSFKSSRDEIDSNT